LISTAVGGLATCPVTMIDIRASRHPDLRVLAAIIYQSIYQFGMKKSISRQAISLQMQVFPFFQELVVKS